MLGIPDAPWIREAERRGTDYMYEFIYGRYEDDEDEDEDDDEGEDDDE